MLGHVGTEPGSHWCRAQLEGSSPPLQPAEARAQLGQVVDQLRARASQGRPGCWRTPRLTCWPSTGCPGQTLAELRSTNPLERVNREIGRRSDVVGIFPNDAALLRLAGMLLLEQNDQ